MRIGALIQARLGSSRLPLKAIRHVGSQPLLCHQIDRLRTVASIEEIAISTTQLPLDDYLIEFGDRHNIRVCRGPADRPLTRHWMSATELGLDPVVVTGGDNPFVDPELTERLIGFHAERGHDLSLYAYGSLPLGSVPFCVVGVSLLSRMRGRIREGEDWVSQLILGHHNEFSLGVLRESAPACSFPGLRITVDELPDLALVSRLAETLGSRGQLFSLRDIVRHLQQHPELARVNRFVRQRYPEYWPEFTAVLDAHTS